jgi:hypothetical protein
MRQASLLLPFLLDLRGVPSCAAFHSMGRSWVEKELSKSESGPYICITSFMNTKARRHYVILSATPHSKIEDSAFHTSSECEWSNTYCPRPTPSARGIFLTRLVLLSKLSTIEQPRL